MFIASGLKGGGKLPSATTCNRRLSADFHPQEVIGRSGSRGRRRRPHDPVADRPARPVGFAHPRLAQFATDLAGTFHQDFHLLADQGLILFQINRILHGQQFVIPPPLHFLGDVVGVELCRPRCRARGLYLKMKLFLNRAWRTSSTVCWKSSSVSPQKPTMKSLVTAAWGISADAVEHFAVFLDRVAPLHPLQDRVGAALRRHVQVGRDLGHFANRLQQVGASCAGESW